MAFVLSALNPSFSGLQAALLIIGGAGIISGATAWTVLWLTAQKSANVDPPGFISVPAAGDWLYSQGSERLRAWLRSDVPDRFATVRDSGAAWVHAAARPSGCSLYGRHGDGLPLEVLSHDEVEMENLLALVQTETEALAATYVQRRDLKKILNYYETAIADAGGPPKA